MRDTQALLSRRSETMTSRVRLADGRDLAWCSYGDAEGVPVMALHGTPGSRLKYATADSTARAYRIRLVSLDRWGYGLSDPHPAPTLRAFAEDVSSLADALGLDRFGVVGISGGGPFAAALAACLPRRVSALALVVPVGEIKPPGRRPPMSTFHRLCFDALPHVPGAVRGTFGMFRLVTRMSPTTAARLAAARAGAADRAVFRQPGFAAALGATFREGLARGAVGPVIDISLFARPWRIDLGEIAAPARVWIGTADRNVPRGPAEALASAIPGATLSRREGAGHFWIARQFDEVLAWLAAAGHGQAWPESKRRP